VWRRFLSGSLLTWVWMQSVMSLMKTMKSVDDITPRCGTPSLTFEVMAECVI
jgi:hypothetical protein